MKNLLKLKVFLLVFIIIYTSNAVLADQILPLAKPTVDKEIKVKTAKKKKIKVFKVLKVFIAKFKGIFRFVMILCCYI